MFFSFTVKYSKRIHVNACTFLFFIFIIARTSYCSVIFYSIDITLFFCLFVLKNPFPSGGILDCCQFFAILSEAAIINMFVQVLL